MATNSLLLESDSVLLLISMENDEESISFNAKDQASIVIETNQQSKINAVNLAFDNDDENQLNFSIPFDGSNSIEKIRLETLLLLANVHDSGKFVLKEKRSNRMKKKSKKEVRASVRIDFTGGKTISDNQPIIMLNASLLIENKQFPVSKELLINGSKFFDSLFNGDYSEKEKGVYEIKEVNSTDFWWFLRSFMTEEWNFTTRNNALMALNFADRFGFSDIHQHIFSLLKTKKVKLAQLSEMFIVFGRFNDNQEIFKWIFDQYKSEKDSFKLIHDSVPDLSGISIQSAMKAWEAIIDERKVKERRKLKQARMEEKMRDLSSSISDAVADEDCELIVAYHNEDDDIERVDTIHVGRYGYDHSDRTFCMDEYVWGEMPEKYNLIRVEPDWVFRREDGDGQKCKRTYRVMDVHAYIAKDGYKPNKTEQKEAKKKPIAPKRGMSAYFYWLIENRARLTKPGMSVTDVSKQAGLEWAAVEDKSEWEARADQDKKRYEAELAEYKRGDDAQAVKRRRN